MFFDKIKKDFLSKPDKSGIRAIDNAIISLVNKINKNSRYYTTSSCAGRIILMKETGKKQENAFLFRSHDKINNKTMKNELNNAIKKYNGIIYLKHEPCIMHVACCSLNDALNLTNLARQCGWKKSGIISKSNVVEMLSTEILAVPVADKGKIIVNDNYLDILVSESNKKLALTRQKIKNLEKKIK